MDASLTVKEALTLIFDRTDSVRVLWNFYIIVSLGLVGFLAKAGSGASTLRLSRLIAVGFGLFAVSNAGAMLQTQREREALVRILDSQALGAPFDTLKEAVHVWPVWSVVTFHAVMDLMVILCILWLGRRGMQSKGEA